MKRSATIGVRVDPQVKRAAEDAALDDHRSVASLLEKLLIVYLRKAGYLHGEASLRVIEEADDLELAADHSQTSD